MNNILGFGKFIAYKRKSLGITLRGMAAELGISPAYLSDIEKGKIKFSSGRCNRRRNFLASLNLKIDFCEHNC